MRWLPPWLNPRELARRLGRVLSPFEVDRAAAAAQEHERKRGTYRVAEFQNPSSMPDPIKRRLCTSKVQLSPSLRINVPDDAEVSVGQVLDALIPTIESVARGEPPRRPADRARPEPAEPRRAEPRRAELPPELLAQIERIRGKLTPANEEAN